MSISRMMVAVSCAVCASLALLAMPCRAGEPGEPGRATLDKLLKAVEANDYDSFVADGTVAFKAGITKSTLQSVSEQLSTRMKEGYTCSHLGELKQQGMRVLLWKLTYKDGGDDTLVRLALRNGKVAGVLLTPGFSSH